MSLIISRSGMLGVAVDEALAASGATPTVAGTAPIANG
jgi:hypothetical protein